MDAKIDSSIWWWMNGQGLCTAEKVAYMWAITNAERDLAGCFTWNVGRFKSETEQSEIAFDEMLKKVDGKIVRVGKTIWIRSFIERQFGRGPSMARSNVVKSLVRLISTLPMELQAMILEQYPELSTSPFGAPYKPLTSPSPSPSDPLLRALANPEAPCGQAPSEPLTSPSPSPSEGFTHSGTTKSRAEQSRAVPEGGMGETDPTLEEVMEVAKFAGVPDATAVKFFEHYNTLNLWRNRHGRLIRWRHKLVTWKVQDAAQQFEVKNKNHGPGQRSAAQARYDEIDGMLPGASPEQKITLIREQAQLKAVLQTS